MENNRHFGNLNVGVLVDAYGPVREAARILAAGVDHMVESEVDLIVCNWSHPGWAAAARQLGFVAWASNYLLFALPAPAAAILPLAGPRPDIHLTRGDSDGMVSFRRGAVPLS